MRAYESEYWIKKLSERRLYMKIIKVFTALLTYESYLKITRKSSMSFVDSSRLYFYLSTLFSDQVRVKEIICHLKITNQSSQVVSFYFQLRIKYIFFLI